MAFKIGANTVIDNNNALIHSSFQLVPGTTQSTQVVIRPNEADGIGSTASSFFGQSVAVGSGRIVVGAYGNDYPVSNQGAAYVYGLNGGSQLLKLSASDGASADFFGWSVAVGSGRIVVGAYQDDDNGSNSGSAYIFDLNGTQLAKIKASDGEDEDFFGYDVAVGSGRIVVGAYQDDDNGSNSGSAYIFDLNGTQLTKIKASDGVASDNFGFSVAIGNGLIVVGARGVNSEGAVYIFDILGNFLRKITPSDPLFNSTFGFSVAVGSGRIVVGRPGPSTGNGSTYIFDLNGTQLAKIVASDGGSGDKFGNSVSVNSGYIVVGAEGDDDNQLDAGAAYIFNLNGTQLAKITSNDLTSGLDAYGREVSIGNGRIVCGSPGDDFLGSAAGAAYIYKLPETSDTYFENVLDTYRY